MSWFCQDIWLWLFTHHLLINLLCSYKTNISPPSRDSSRTAAPAIHFFEQVPSSVPSQDSEEDSLPPHLLLPDSISQLEEFGRQKKWHKKHYKNHRQRQFNDLWVRIEDGWVEIKFCHSLFFRFLSIFPKIAPVKDDIFLCPWGGGICFPLSLVIKHALQSLLAISLQA